MSSALNPEHEAGEAADHLMNRPGWWVYILRCGDGSLYTGITTDVNRRLSAHRSGHGAKYTRTHLPVTLVYREAQDGKSQALRREAAIKQLTRAQKLRLIAGASEQEAFPMRRKDREMDEAFALQIVDGCEYAFLAMTAEDGSPYGIPITIARDGRSIYFHSAMAGRKADCLRARPRVCLSCVGKTQIIEEEFTTLFESAVVFGTAVEITDETEKLHALRLICQRHTPHAMDGFDAAAARSIRGTAVFRIDIAEITGKAKRRKSV